MNKNRLINVGLFFIYGIIVCNLIVDTFYFNSVRFLYKSNTKYILYNYRGLNSFKIITYFNEMNF